MCSSPTCNALDNFLVVKFLNVIMFFNSRHGSWHSILVKNSGLGNLIFGFSDKFFWPTLIILNSVFRKCVNSERGQGDFYSDLIQCSACIMVDAQITVNFVNVLVERF